VGYTIIDSIGSLLVMDLVPQYQRARDWVMDSLDFDKDANFNTFEVSLYRCASQPMLLRGKLLMARQLFVYSVDCYQRITSPLSTHFQRSKPMHNSTSTARST
jgi:hypothetical protein